MRVWIDQDLCTGDGLCVEIAPKVFELRDDGLAYVLHPDGSRDDYGGSEGLVDVPTELEEVVIESSVDCPGSCIFIEDDPRAPYTPETYK